MFLVGEGQRLEALVAAVAAEVAVLQLRQEHAAPAGGRFSLIHVDTL